MTVVVGILSPVLSTNHPQMFAASCIFCGRMKMSSQLESCGDGCCDSVQDILKTVTSKWHIAWNLVD